MRRVTAALLLAALLAGCAGQDASPGSTTTTTKPFPRSDSDYRYLNGGQVRFQCNGTVGVYAGATVEILANDPNCAPEVLR